MRAEKDTIGWLDSLSGNDRVVICPVVRGEILFGISKLVEGKRRSALEQSAHLLFASIACEPMPESAGDHYAAIKFARQRRGLVLDENDLWIAATALTLNATLVSKDKDFKDIEGLLVKAPTLGG